MRAVSDKDEPLTDEDDPQCRAAGADLMLHPLRQRSRHKLARLTGKSPISCPALPLKIFWFSETANQFNNPLRLVPLEGRIAIVTDAGRDAVDASGASDESAFLADGKIVWS